MLSISGHIQAVICTVPEIKASSHILGCHLLRWAEECSPTSQRPFLPSVTHADSGGFSGKRELEEAKYNKIKCFLLAEGEIEKKSDLGTEGQKLCLAGVAETLSGDNPLFQLYPSSEETGPQYPSSNSTGSGLAWHRNDSPQLWLRGKKTAHRA